MSGGVPGAAEVGSLAVWGRGPGELDEGAGFGAWGEYECSVELGGGDLVCGVFGVGEEAGGDDVGAECGGGDVSGVAMVA